jgi:hypothetical protein
MTVRSYSKIPRYFNIFFFKKQLNIPLLAEKANFLIRWADLFGKKFSDRREFRGSLFGCKTNLIELLKTSLRRLTVSP